MGVLRPIRHLFISPSSLIRHSTFPRFPSDSLGVPALLVVTRPDPLAYDRRQTLLNAMVSQGDIVLLHMSAEDNCDCQVSPLISAALFTTAPC